MIEFVDWYLTGLAQFWSSVIRISLPNLLLILLLIWWVKGRGRWRCGGRSGCGCWGYCCCDSKGCGCTCGGCCCQRDDDHDEGDEAAAD